MVGYCFNDDHILKSPDKRTQRYHLWQALHRARSLQTPVQQDIQRTIEKMALQRLGLLCQRIGDSSRKVWTRKTLKRPRS